MVMTEHEKIKKILDVFSVYIAHQQTFDVVESKYGCLVLLPMNHENTVFDIKKYTTAEALCDRMFDMLVQEYLCERGIYLLVVPQEYITDFMENIKIYLTKLPEYAYLLDHYMQQGEVS